MVSVRPSIPFATSDDAPSPRASTSRPRACRHTEASPTARNSSSVTNACPECNGELQEPDEAIVMSMYFGMPIDEAREFIAQKDREAGETEQ